MDAEFAQWLIAVLLGSGGAAFIWTVTRSYLAIHGRVDQREDRALERMEHNETDARGQLVQERMWGSYWFHRAAVLERELILHKIDIPDTGPEPVSTTRNGEQT